MPFPVRTPQDSHFHVLFWSPPFLDPMSLESIKHHPAVLSREWFHKLNYCLHVSSLPMERTDFNKKKKRKEDRQQLGDEEGARVVVGERETLSQNIGHSNTTICSTTYSIHMCTHTNTCTQTKTKECWMYTLSYKTQCGYLLKLLCLAGILQLRSFLPLGLPTELCLILPPLNHRQQVAIYWE